LNRVLIGMATTEKQLTYDLLDVIAPVHIPIQTTVCTTLPMAHPILHQPRNITVSKMAMGARILNS
jgi:hypothetical protein